MTRLERRQVPRMTVEGFAYINIDPNNGGSVLNVSEDGLCFHSIAPVPRDRPINFWFSGQDHRIEGVGELAWIDDAQKTAGVRFTSLSAEAREQIRRWTSLPAPAAVADTEPRVFSALGAARLDRKASTSGLAPVAVVSPKLKESTQLSAFSRGLLTGLLVAVVVTAGFTINAYRQDFGEWLIQLGQRFATKPQVQTQAPPAQPAVVSTQQTLPVPPIVPAASAATLSPTPPPPGKPEPQPPATPAKAIQAPPEPEKSVPVLVVPANSHAPKVVARADAQAILPAPPALPSATHAVNPDVLPGKSAALPQLAAASHPEPAAPPNEHVEVATEESGKASTGPPPEMYFEVGRSKDSQGAHQISDKLETLGFHSSVSQKSRLWSNSYAVLVGPYSDEDAAAQAGKALLTHDFRPRPFERGSRDIELRSGLTLNGERIPGGECSISWESYITGTVVKVWQDRSVIAKSDGRWRKNTSKYKRDAFVYRKNLDGSKTLLEIQFTGLSKALVFGNPS